MSFMAGYGAAVQLMRRAQGLGCFVEAVCLSTSVIDASLRIGIILKHQLTNRTEEMLNLLLNQSEGDPILLEREIYKIAKGKHVIDDSQFKLLNELYGKRNRIIHRYIISDITTQDVVDIAKQYDALLDSIHETIKGLEDEQIAQGHGTVRSGPRVPIEQIRCFSDAKHGSSSLTEQLRRSEPSA